MKTAILIVCALTMLALGATPALAVKGNWHTDPDLALAAAEKLKTPILAVAMDHG